MACVCATAARLQMSHLSVGDTGLGLVRDVRRAPLAILSAASESVVIHRLRWGTVLPQREAKPINRSEAGICTEQADVLYRAVQLCQPSVITPDVIAWITTPRAANHLTEPYLSRLMYDTSVHSTTSQCNITAVPRVTSQHRTPLIF